MLVPLWRAAVKGVRLLLGLFHAGAVPANVITWGLGDHGLLRNLVLTTGGNFVGGALLVAVPSYATAELMRAGR